MKENKILIMFFIGLVIMVCFLFFGVEQYKQDLENIEKDFCSDADIRGYVTDFTDHKCYLETVNDEKIYWKDIKGDEKLKRN